MIGDCGVRDVVEFKRLLEGAISIGLGGQTNEAEITLGEISAGVNHRTTNLAEILSSISG